eukprot:TRINITY_DN1039_c0_g1_i9.p1 TRINITY_DN1039_c0_g1~~TRINITY_DN1039_c0_g1_i9.p1  ORF type:complete len:1062 (+),score=207.41 TRINITY_DN1039_c0_g1_i9:86-3271(+)
MAQQDTPESRPMRALRGNIIWAAGAEGESPLVAPGAAPALPGSRRGSAAVARSSFSRGARGSVAHHRGSISMPPRTQSGNLRHSPPPTMLQLPTRGSLGGLTASPLEPQTSSTFEGGSSRTLQSLLFVEKSKVRKLEAKINALRGKHTAREGADSALIAVVQRLRAAWRQLALSAYLPYERQKMTGVPPRQEAAPTGVDALPQLLTEAVTGVEGVGRWLDDLDLQAYLRKQEHHGAVDNSVERRRTKPTQTVPCIVVATTQVLRVQAKLTVFRSQMTRLRDRVRGELTAFETAFFEAVKSIEKAFVAHELEQLRSPLTPGRSFRMGPRRNVSSDNLQVPDGGAAASPSSSPALTSGGAAARQHLQDALAAQRKLEARLEEEILQRTRLEQRIEELIAAQKSGKAVDLSQLKVASPGSEDAARSALAGARAAAESRKVLDKLSNMLSSPLSPCVEDAPYTHARDHLTRLCQWAVDPKLTVEQLPVVLGSAAAYIAEALRVLGSSACASLKQRAPRRAKKDQGPGELSPDGCSAAQSLRKRRKSRTQGAGSPSGPGTPADEYPQAAPRQETVLTVPESRGGRNRSRRGRLQQSPAASASAQSTEAAPSLPSAPRADPGDTPGRSPLPGRSYRRLPSPTGGSDQGSDRPRARFPQQPRHSPRQQTAASMPQKDDQLPGRDPSVLLAPQYSSQLPLSSGSDSGTQEWDGDEEEEEEEEQEWAEGDGLRQTTMEIPPALSPASAGRGQQLPRSSAMAGHEGPRGREPATGCEPPAEQAESTSFAVRDGITGGPLTDGELGDAARVAQRLHVLADAGITASRVLPAGHCTGDDGKRPAQLPTVFLPAGVVPAEQQRVAFSRADPVVLVDRELERAVRDRICFCHRCGAGPQAPDIEPGKAVCPRQRCAAGCGALLYFGLRAGVPLGLNEWRLWRKHITPLKQPVARYGAICSPGTVDHAARLPASGSPSGSPPGQALRPRPPSPDAPPSSAAAATSAAADAARFPRGATASGCSRPRPARPNAAVPVARPGTQQYGLKLPPVRDDYTQASSVDGWGQTGSALSSGVF